MKEWTRKSLYFSLVVSQANQHLYRDDIWNTKDTLPLSQCLFLLQRLKRAIKQNKPNLSHSLWFSHQRRTSGTYPFAQSRCHPGCPPACHQGGGALRCSTSACWTSPSPLLHQNARWLYCTAPGRWAPMCGQRCWAPLGAPWATCPAHTQTTSQVQMVERTAAMHVLLGCVFFFF